MGPDDAAVDSIRENTDPRYSGQVGVHCTIGSRDRFGDVGGLYRLRDGVDTSRSPLAGYADAKLHSARQLRL